MRQQSALFIDAGYLIAGAATRLTGSSLRRSVTVDYKGLVESLLTLAEKHASMPVLRAYWYDASPNGVPDSDHERIAALPKVKVRLGRVGMEGEQKGVDLRIGLDMVGHSRNGAVDTIFLLSGDDDLTEAVEEAQAQGVSVVVLAMPTSAGSPHGLSRNLFKSADEVVVLESELLDSVVQVAKILVGHSPQKSVKIPTPADMVPGLKHSLRAPSAQGDNPPHTPTPNSLVSSGAGVDHRRRENSGKEKTHHSGSENLLAYSTASGSSSYIAPSYQRDSEERTSLIGQVVEKTYRAWKASATQEQYLELLQGRPTIPQELDRALLIDASDALGDYYLSNEIRSEIRATFWRNLDEEEII